MRLHQSVMRPPQNEAASVRDEAPQNETAPIRPEEAPQNEAAPIRPEEAPQNETAPIRDEAQNETAPIRDEAPTPAPTLPPPSMDALPYPACVGGPRGHAAGDRVTKKLATRLQIELLSCMIRVLLACDCTQPVHIQGD